MYIVVYILKSYFYILTVIYNSCHFHLCVYWQKAFDLTLPWLIICYFIIFLSLHGYSFTCLSIHHLFVFVFTTMIMFCKYSEYLLISCQACQFISYHSASVLFVQSTKMAFYCVFIFLRKKKAALDFLLLGLVWCISLLFMFTGCEFFFLTGMLPLGI